MLFPKYLYSLIVLSLLILLAGCQSDTNENENIGETGDDYYLRFKLNGELVDYSHSNEAQINIYGNTANTYSAVLIGTKEVEPFMFSTISISLVLRDGEIINEETYINPDIYNNIDENGLPIYPSMSLSLNFPPSQVHLGISAIITFDTISDNEISGTFSSELGTGTNVDNVTNTITDGEFKLELTN